VRHFDVTAIRATAIPLAALAVVLAVGLAVRVVGLADNPPGFSADEATVGVNAHLVLTTGRDENGLLLPIFFPAFGEQKHPIFVYAAIPFVALLGLSETAVRLTAATMGTLTIVTVFLLARAMFGTRAGLAVAMVLAVTPWHIHYSRTSFELI
jgi:4-amino-4-deoxy-L-arabinose transferase-like glycosyltransferase